MVTIQPYALEVPQEVKMPRKGPKPPYRPKIEYRYTVKDVAEAAGMTRNAVGRPKGGGW